MDQYPKRYGRSRAKDTLQPPRLVGAQPTFPRPPIALKPLAPSWPRQPAQVLQTNQIRGPGSVKNHQSKSQAVKIILFNSK